MRPIAALLLTAAFITSIPTSHARGLRFQGLDKPIDERTSLHIVPGLGTVRDSLTVSFSIRSYQENRYGQLARIPLGKDHTSPTVVLLYDGSGSYHLFRAIWEGRRIVAEVAIEKDRQGNPSQWIPVKVTIDRVVGRVSLNAGNLSSVGAMDMPERIRPDIVFGRDGDHTDACAFAMKDLSIRKDNNRTIVFDLSETEGRIASSNCLIYRGICTNPVWLSRDSYHWKKAFTRKSQSYQSAGYYPVSHNIYSLDRDSLLLVEVDGQAIRRERFREPCPLDIRLGSSFVNPNDGKIYAYEPYYNNDNGDIPPDKPTMASLDGTTLSWDVVSTYRFPQHMHHHNCVVDSIGNDVLVFGGFGMSKYNGDFYRFSLDSLTWRVMPKTWGSPLWPRFQGSMGIDPHGGTLYIYGGMGNESGEQVVGRQYFYDLHSVDLLTGKCRKLWELSWEGPNTVAVRDMVLDDDGHFYTLLYTESITESFLNLYRFNISDGQHTILADPIPIYSDRITCQGNIYVDRERNKLIAIVEESADDIRSTVTAYTLDFPPSENKGPVPLRLKLISAGIALAAALGAIFLVGAARRRRRHGLLRGRIPSSIKQPSYGTNSVSLFGDFSATDKDGVNITSLFSGRIRHLFYLLVEGQAHDGVTSKHISNTLWPDKEYLQAKNIRGVTMTSLRKILSRFDGISLEFDNGRYRFNLSERFHCDYLEFLSILGDTEPDMDRLLGILSRGNLLQAETDPIFDKLKNDTEQMIEPIILSEMPRRFSLRQFQNTLLCANILVRIDPLNEDALKYTVRALVALGKEDEAKSRYRDFTHRYKTDYSEDFSASFDQLLSF